MVAADSLWPMLNLDAHLTVNAGTHQHMLAVRAVWREPRHGYTSARAATPGCDVEGISASRLGEGATLAGIAHDGADCDQIRGGRAASIRYFWPAPIAKQLLGPMPAVCGARSHLRSTFRLLVRARPLPHAPICFCSRHLLFSVAEPEEACGAIAR